MRHGVWAKLSRWQEAAASFSRKRMVGHHHQTKHGVNSVVLTGSRQSSTYGHDRSLVDVRHDLGSILTWREALIRHGRLPAKHRLVCAPDRLGATSASDS